MCTPCLRPESMSFPATGLGRPVCTLCSPSLPSRHPKDDSHRSGAVMMDPPTTPSSAHGALAASAAGVRLSSASGDAVRPSTRGRVAGGARATKARSSTA